jgi:hypothetical protein
MLLLETVPVVTIVTTCTLSRRSIFDRNSYFNQSRLRVLSLGDAVLRVLAPVLVSDLLKKTLSLS